MAISGGRSWVTVERALPIGLRREARHVVQAETQPAGLGGHKGAGHFIVGSLFEQHPLWGLVAAGEIEPSVAQRAVGLEPKPHLTAFERLHALEGVGLFFGLQPGVGRRRDLHEGPLQLRGQHHAQPDRFGEAGPVFGVGHDQQFAPDVAGQLFESTAALVEHGNGGRLVGMARWKCREKDLPGLMSGCLDFDDEVLAVRDVSAGPAGLGDLEPGKGIGRVIAIRIDKPGGLDDRNPGKHRQHGRKSQQTKGRPFGLPAQFAGPSQPLQRRAPQLAPHSRPRPVAPGGA